MPKLQQRKLYWKKIQVRRKHEKENYQEKVSEKKSLGFGLLMVQGIATSIDALSVGFTISDYNWLMALIAALIIGLETFGICIAGLKIGRKIGEKIEGSAQIIGGLILIGIGVEIFVKGVFFGS